MRQARAFRPAIDGLEGRVVLSFSISKFFHQILPFIPDNSKKAPAETPAERAHQQAVIAQRHAARIAAAAAHSAATLPAAEGAVHPSRNPHDVTFNWYANGTARETRLIEAHVAAAARQTG